jgi:hypothetical protein
MGTRILQCPNCDAASHDGSHDEGYVETAHEFVENEEVFGEFVTLYGCMTCGHVWVGY